jgi:hypothetical protein
MLKRGTRQALQFNREHAELVERVVFQRIRGDMRLAQIGFLETVGIDDQDSVGLQVGEIYLQRRGIHGHQNVHGIARGVDFAGRKIQLEAADSGNRAGWGANFGGKVGERGDVVAVDRDRIRKLAAGNLHAVAGIAGEADDGLVNNLPLGFPGRDIHQC